MSELGLINGPDGPEIRLPLFPRKRTQVGHRAMSVSCQQETPAPQQTAFLIDHLSGSRQQRWGDRQVESLRRLEIDNQFVVSRSLNRQVGRLLALQDTINITGCASELFDSTGPIGDQAAESDVKAASVDRRQLVLRR